MTVKVKEMLITPNKWSRPQTKIGKIKNIVVHWVGNAGSTAENNAQYFNSLKDGVVVRCVPESEIAYHASSANNYSIGIEVCHPDSTGKYTDAAYKALIDLLVDLCGRFNLEPTQAVIRHYDVTGKMCPKYYVENEKAWKQLKQDVVDAISKDEELERAVKVLQDKGVISSPELWLKGSYTKKNVRSLIIKVHTVLNKIE